MKQKFIIELVPWQTHAAQLKVVREQVFINEQQVPVALEWDGLDEAAQHLLALSDSGEVIGCARLLADGHIGRMAVLKPWRGSGVGRALLDRAIEFFRQKDIKAVRLSAQMHAIPFYQKAGFEVCSEPYLDAGIPHVDMHLK